MDWFINMFWKYDKFDYTSNVTKQDVQQKK